MMQKEIILRPGDRIPSGIFISGWSLLDEKYPKGTIVIYVK